MQRDLPLLSTPAVAAATGVLAAITNAHALTDAQRARLEGAYKAIAEHLAAHPEFKDVTIEVHPQGSMLLGTTTRPEGRIEIDVDLVVLLIQGLHNHVTCQVLLAALFAALEQHAKRHNLKIKAKRRCIQIEYAGEMHADATPVVHHPHMAPYGTTYALVPDRDLSRYLGTNPKGYAKWFNDAGEQMPLFSLHRDIVAKADIVQLPSAEIFNSLLARIVQLFKIHRNVSFANNADFCPPSILITTLVVHSYLGLLHQVFASPLDLILAIWQDMLHHIERRFLPNARELWVVDNPTANGDNLADRMNQGDRQQQFLLWHMRFRDDLLDLIGQASAARRDALMTRVRKSYGDHSARGITQSFTKAAADQRAAQRIVVPGAIASGTTSAAASAVAMVSRPNRFYGRD
jgi:hypothetical protein